MKIGEMLEIRKKAPSEHLGKDEGGHRQGLLDQMIIEKVTGETKKHMCMIKDLQMIEKHLIAKNIRVHGGCIVPILEKTIDRKRIEEKLPILMEK